MSLIKLVNYWSEKSSFYRSQQLNFFLNPDCSSENFKNENFVEGELISTFSNKKFPDGENKVKIEESEAELRQTEIPECNYCTNYKA